jgi:GNAT superfamily N-acetyltransferase
MTATAQDHRIRRDWHDGDAGAIVDLHRRVYVPEYGRNEVFVGRVAEGVEAAVAAGWPVQSGAVWLVEHEAVIRGSLALTDEGDGVARVRWFVLDAALRGRGLGRALVADLLATARASGCRQLELETFSALTAAATIYREAGFRVAWEYERHDWGDPITYQGYELTLD